MPQARDITTLDRSASRDGLVDTAKCSGAGAGRGGGCGGPQGCGIGIGCGGGFGGGDSKGRGGKKGRSKGRKGDGSKEESNVNININVSECGGSGGGCGGCGGGGGGFNGGCGGGCGLGLCGGEGGCGGCGFGGCGGGGGGCGDGCCGRSLGPLQAGKGGTGGGGGGGGGGGFGGCGGGVGGGGGMCMGGGANSVGGCGGSCGGMGCGGCLGGGCGGVFLDSSCGSGLASGCAGGGFGAACDVATGCGGSCGGGSGGCCGGGYGGGGCCGGGGCGGGPGGFAMGRRGMLSRRQPPNRRGGGCGGGCGPARQAVTLTPAAANKGRGRRGDEKTDDTAGREARGRRFGGDGVWDRDPGGDKDLQPWEKRTQKETERMRIKLDDWYLAVQMLLDYDDRKSYSAADMEQKLTSFLQAERKEHNVSTRATSEIFLRGILRALWDIDRLLRLASNVDELGRYAKSPVVLSILRVMAYELMWVPGGASSNASRNAVELVEKCNLPLRNERDWICGAVARMSDGFDRSHQEWERKRKARDDKRQKEGQVPAARAKGIAVPRGSAALATTPQNPKRRARSLAPCASSPGLAAKRLRPAGPISARADGGSESLPAEISSAQAETDASRQQKSKAARSQAASGTAPGVAEAAAKVDDQAAAEPGVDAAQAEDDGVAEEEEEEEESEEEPAEDEEEEEEDELEEAGEEDGAADQKKRPKRETEGETGEKKTQDRAAADEAVEEEEEDDDEEEEEEVEEEGEEEAEEEDDDEEEEAVAETAGKDADPAAEEKAAEKVDVVRAKPLLLDVDELVLSEDTDAAQRSATQAALKAAGLHASAALQDGEEDSSGLTSAVGKLLREEYPLSSHSSCSPLRMMPIDVDADEDDEITVSIPASVVAAKGASVAPSRRDQTEVTELRQAADQTAVVVATAEAAVDTSTTAAVVESAARHAAGMIRELTLQDLVGVDDDDDDELEEAEEGLAKEPRTESSDLADGVPLARS
eukprot:TRINITY_DN8614_c2_g1_i1.p1 TRINITY_DN8614_c2_g1~~TRINITY_DN8614_c2_g1_i1.p1  ORF type:complete len:1120 (-),score=309.02 TRINITY_DN8614_c2_g1_i1:81-3047(-)